MKELKGRNALITGASRGLGVYIAKKLAAEGINLALAARNVKDLQEVQKIISALGVKAIIFSIDLSENSRINELVLEVEEKLGPIDILINNAGVEFAAPFEEFPVEEIQKSVNVNLLSPMLLSRAVLPRMLTRGRGHIVNISSLAGKTGLPYQAPYATTKAGLVMFSHSLRAELIDQPVGVSVICPGFVSEEGMFARLEKDSGKMPKFLKPTTPEKVANAVLKAIKKDMAELIVNPFPMRSGIIMREIFPQISPMLHKITGTTKFAKEIYRDRSAKQS